jgi:glycosyltransferase involved in cell wall biosynthesis
VKEKQISKLSLIIPAYNEENTIELILNKVFSVMLPNGISKEIIIVDDCSSDETASIIKSYRVANPEKDIQYIKQDFNQGKGAAIHRGIKAATGDYILIQDADLEYDPEEYKRLLKPIISGHADVVYGSRFMGSNPHRILFFWHTIGNKFLTFLSNLFTNLNLTDMETCYKMFDANILKSLNLTENRFGFEPEVTAKISRIKGIRLYEVGISYYGRTYDEGKKINWQDGVKAIYCTVKYGLFKAK